VLGPVVTDPGNPQLNIHPMAAVGEGQWLALVDPVAQSVSYYQDPNATNPNGAPSYAGGAALAACTLFIGDEITSASGTAGYLYAYVPLIPCS
jgi:hypothetical protein